MKTLPPRWGSCKKFYIAGVGDAPYIFCKMKMIQAFVLAFALCILAVPARAEVFVWVDPVYDIHVTFPDNWMRQANLDDDLRFSILAPQGADHAACRLYASTDGRFMDAPPEAGQDVSALVFNNEALLDEMVRRGDVRDATVAEFVPHATLGRGAATLSYIDFRKVWAGGLYDMRAMVFGSQYHGRRFTMSCESLAGAWEIWQPVFKSIVKSVDFPPAFTVWPNGYYRPFQNEGSVYLPVNRRRDAISTH